MLGVDKKLRLTATGHMTGPLSDQSHSWHFAIDRGKLLSYGLIVKDVQHTHDAGPVALFCGFGADKLNRGRELRAFLLIFC